MRRRGGGQRRAKIWRSARSFADACNRPGGAVRCFFLKDHGSHRLLALSPVLRSPFSSLTNSRSRTAPLLRAISLPSTSRATKRASGVQKCEIHRELREGGEEEGEEEEEEEEEWES